MPGRVLESGEPAWIVDVTKDPNFPRAKLSKDIGVHGAFGFPVRASNHVVAVLEFFDEQADEPDESLLATVGDIGTQLGRVFERKQAEEQLANHARRLEEANAMLSEFAYAASHDLKAPIRAIRNYADVLIQDLGETLEGEHQSYFQGLQRATKEADELIDDLLSYCQMGTAKFPVEKLNLGNHVRDVLMGLSIPDDVDVEVAEDWPVVETVPTLIKQIIQNLVTNAVKFGPKENKRVELGCRTDDKTRVEIFVKDNGIGIKPRHFEQIYEVFKRLHTREEYEGTGIGLAIVKKAAGRLNGEVRVESEPGAGTTFIVSLPLRQVEDT